MRKADQTNTFQEGILMDLNPLIMPDNTMTTALNATLMTMNGNENVLQNDMGNGRVETAYLPEGYIPLGSTSFGGIIYVVSYNPLTNKSQIGSFPSPERNISSSEVSDLNTILTNNDFGVTVSNDNPNTQGATKYYIKKIINSDLIFYPGDKFIVYSPNVTDNYPKFYQESQYDELLNTLGTQRAQYLSNIQIIQEQMPSKEFNNLYQVNIDATKVELYELLKKFPNFSISNNITNQIQTSISDYFNNKELSTIAQQNIRSYNNQLLLNNNEIAVLESKNVQASNQIQINQNYIDTIYQPEIDKLDAQITSIKSNFPTLLTAIEEAKNKQIEAEKQVNDQNSIISELTAQKNGIEIDLLSKTQEKADNEELIASLQAELDNIQLQQTAQEELVKSKQDRLTQVTEIINNYDSNLKAIDDEIAKLETDLTNYNNDNSTRVSELNELINSTNTTISDYKVQIEDLNKKIEDATLNKENINTSIQQVSSNITNLNNQIESSQNTIDNYEAYTWLVNRNESISEVINAYQNPQTNSISLLSTPGVTMAPGIVEEIRPGLDYDIVEIVDQEQFNKYNTEFQENSIAISNLLQKLPEGFDAVQFEQIKQEVEDTKAEVSTLENQLTAYKEQISSIESTLSDLTSDLEEAKSYLDSNQVTSASYQNELSSTNNGRNEIQNNILIQETNKLNLQNEYKDSLSEQVIISDELEMSQKKLETIQQSFQTKNEEQLQYLNLSTQYTQELQTIRENLSNQEDKISIEYGKLYEFQNELTSKQNLVSQAQHNYDLEYAKLEEPENLKTQYQNLINETVLSNDSLTTIKDSNENRKQYLLQSNTTLEAQIAEASTSIQPEDKLLLDFKDSIDSIQKAETLDISKVKDHTIKLNIGCLTKDGKITILDKLNSYKVTSSGDKFQIFQYSGEEQGILDSVDQLRTLTSSPYNIFDSKISGNIVLIAELVQFNDFDVSISNDIIDSNGSNLYRPKFQLGLTGDSYFIPKGVKFTISLDSNSEELESVTFYVNFFKNTTDTLDSDDIQINLDNEIHETTGDFKTYSINVDTNSLVNQGLQAIFNKIDTYFTQTRNKNYIFNVTITPYMNWGYLDSMTKYISVELDKLGTGEVTITTWKYYVSESSKQLTLDWAIESYLKNNQKINDISFNFSCLAENQESTNEDKYEVSTYVYNIEYKDNYFGSYTEVISLDDKDGQLSYDNIYCVHIVINISDGEQIIIGKMLFTIPVFNDIYVKTDVLDFNNEELPIDFGHTLKANWLKENSTENSKLISNVVNPLANSLDEYIDNNKQIYQIHKCRDLELDLDVYPKLINNNKRLSEKLEFDLDSLGTNLEVGTFTPSSGEVLDNPWRGNITFSYVALNGTDVNDYVDKFKTNSTLGYDFVTYKENYGYFIAVGSDQDNINNSLYKKYQVNEYVNMQAIPIGTAGGTFKYFRPYAYDKDTRLKEVDIVQLTSSSPKVIYPKRVKGFNVHHSLADGGVKNSSIRYTTGDEQINWIGGKFSYVNIKTATGNIDGEKYDCTYSDSIRFKMDSLPITYYGGNAPIDGFFFLSFAPVTSSKECTTLIQKDCSTGMQVLIGAKLHKVYHGILIMLAINYGNQTVILDDCVCVWPDQNNSQIYYNTDSWDNDAIKEFINSYLSLCNSFYIYSTENRSDYYEYYDFIYTTSASTKLTIPYTVTYYTNEINGNYICFCGKSLTNYIEETVQKINSNYIFKNHIISTNNIRVTSTISQNSTNEYIITENFTVSSNDLNYLIFQDSYFTYDYDGSTLVNLEHPEPDTNQVYLRNTNNAIIYNESIGNISYNRFTFDENLNRSSSNTGILNFNSNLSKFGYNGDKIYLKDNTGFERTQNFINAQPVNSECNEKKRAYLMGFSSNYLMRDGKSVINIPYATSDTEPSGHDARVL